VTENTLKKRKVKITGDFGGLKIIEKPEKVIGTPPGGEKGGGTQEKLALLTAVRKV